MSEEFNISHVFREALAVSVSADPRDAVPLVLDRIPPRRRGEALVQALRLLAPTFAAGERSAGGGQSSSDTQTSAAPAGVPKKLLAAEEFARLAERYPTPDGYRFLRDMTAEDLRYAATLRRRHAEGAIRNAEWLEKLAATVEEAGLVVVGDLASEVLSELVR